MVRVTKTSFFAILAISLTLFSGVFVFAQTSESKESTLQRAGITGSKDNTPYVPLEQIIAGTGAVFRWDPFLETGELTKGLNTVRFKIGLPLILINYKTKVEPVEVKRNERGEIIFSSKAGRAIVDLFRDREIKEDATDGSGAVHVKAIIIDPGHGGKDPGAIGRHSVNGKQLVLKEKDVVLTVALELYRLLKSEYPSKEIILTRKDDTYITLEGRTEIANKVKLKDNEAMIFVSIHANASLNKRSRGFEIWYLPTDYRRKLLDPDSLGEDLKEVAPILNSMLEEEFTVESILLAKQIESELDISLGGAIPNRGLKEESWFVVRNAKMPAVLIELGFITNKDEALLLKDSEYLKKMSKGIYNGVSGFVNHFDVQSTE